jgi:hypothetical protein
MLSLRLVLGTLLVLGPLRAADVEFLTQELPWAVVDKSYAPPPLEVRTSGACTSGGISYAVVSGALPPGLQLSRLGYFSGVPLRTGSFEIAVRVATGCSWTTKHFTLISTGSPVLSATPTKLEFRGKSGDPGLLEQAVQISATWPKLAYGVQSSVDWLVALPERGFTPRESSALTSDTVHVRIDPVHLKPGRYQAVLVFSAWQAATLRIPVEVNITE